MPGLANPQVAPVAGALCPVGVSDRTVSTTADASDLSNELNCSGPGHFAVNWSGEVSLTQTIAISNGKSVNISGHAGNAVIYGGSAVRLFEVNDGSTLELHGLSLVGGRGGNEGSFAEYGGAVLVSNRSRLAAFSCSFIGNSATSFGGRTCVIRNILRTSSPYPVGCQYPDSYHPCPAYWAMPYTQCHLLKIPRIACIRRNACEECGARIFTGKY